MNIKLATRYLVSRVRKENMDIKYKTEYMEITRDEPLSVDNLNIWGSEGWILSSIIRPEDSSYLYIFFRIVVTL